MKQPDLIRYLKKHGCEPLLEGSNHAVYVNRPTMKVSAVPLQHDIDGSLASKICRDLHVREPT
jgi:hypothetical protein